MKGKLYAHGSVGYLITLGELTIARPAGDKVYLKFNSGGELRFAEYFVRDVFISDEIYDDLLCFARKRAEIEEKIEEKINAALSSIF